MVQKIRKHKQSYRDYCMERSEARRSGNSHRTERRNKRTSF